MYIWLYKISSSEGMVGSGQLQESLLCKVLTALELKGIADIPVGG